MKYRRIIPKTYIYYRYILIPRQIGKCQFWITDPEIYILNGLNTQVRHLLCDNTMFGWLYELFIHGVSPSNQQLKQYVCSSNIIFTLSFAVVVAVGVIFVICSIKSTFIKYQRSQPIIWDVSVPECCQHDELSNINEVKFIPVDDIAWNLVHSTTGHAI